MHKAYVYQQSSNPRPKLQVLQSLQPAAAHVRTQKSLLTEQLLCTPCQKASCLLLGILLAQSWSCCCSRTTRSCLNTLNPADPPGRLPCAEQLGFGEELVWNGLPLHTRIRT